MATITVFSATRASAVLTVSGGNLADAETVTIGGKVYTLKSTLDNVDGHVFLGVSDAAALANLAAAINLSGVAGTDYATLMTANSSVFNAVAAATTLTVYARTPGKTGGFVPTTETCLHAAWSGATLASGTDGVGSANADLVTFIAKLLADVQLNAQGLQYVLRLQSELISST